MLSWIKQHLGLLCLHSTDNRSNRSTKIKVPHDQGSHPEKGFLKTHRVTEVILVNSALPSKESNNTTIIYRYLLLWYIH